MYWQGAIGGWPLLRRRALTEIEWIFSCWSRLVRRETRAVIEGTYCNDRLECLDDLLSVQWGNILGLVARHAVGDVVEELGEQSDLEKLIVRQQLEYGEAIGLQVCRKWTVRQRSARSVLYLSKRGRADVRKAIRCRELERCSSDSGDSGSGRESKDGKEMHTGGRRVLEFGKCG